MTIFPSENEKIITTVIVSTNIGFIVGFFVGSNVTDKNIFITSLATLVAAFVGVWLSYKLQDNVKKREEVRLHIDNSNELLFSLYQKLNALKIFQIDLIEPWRDKPERYLGMMPMLDFNLPKTKIKQESISFLLGTKHENLLFDIHIEDERFKVAEDVIRFRSHLHLNKVQPALDASGIIDGAEYTDAQYKEALGEMLYLQLKKATDDVICHVDRTVESSNKLGEKLFNALKDIYPKKKFVQFVLLDKVLNEDSN